MVRFEILLPLFYNDGRQIEREKFLQTDDDLIQRFGAISTDTVTVRGQWLYQSTLYVDQLIRVRLDLQDTPEIWQEVRAFKEALKTRFDQVDIWITAHRIDVI
jgi:hypothetical protein